MHSREPDDLAVGKVKGELQSINIAGASAGFTNAALQSVAGFKADGIEIRDRDLVGPEADLEGSNRPRLMAPRQSHLETLGRERSVRARNCFCCR